MSRQFVIAVLLLISFIALAPTSVEAQSAYRFKVDVPFPFVLNGQTLPAGTYVIERTDPAVWTICRSGAGSDGQISS